VVALVEDEAIAARVLAAWTELGFTGFTARVESRAESRPAMAESLL